MNNIIIYGSHYGATERYAKELSKETNIEAVTFKEIANINHYDQIIYIGGLYAGGVYGMSKTLKKLKDIKSKKIIIATVGLADPKNEKNIKNIKNHMKKQLDEDIFKNAKIFHLRGAIDYSKLGFIHKTMMKALIIKIKRTSNDKKTSEDKMILETYNKKVDFVDLSSLNEILNEIIL